LKPFFLQLIDKQGPQRELCTHTCLLHGQESLAVWERGEWGRRVN